MSEKLIRMSELSFLVGRLIGHLEYNLDQRSDLSVEDRAKIRATIAEAEVFNIAALSTASQPQPERRAMAGRAGSRQ